MSERRADPAMPAPAGDTAIGIRPLQRTDLGALLALYRHLHRADTPPADETFTSHVWDEICADSRQRVFGGHAGNELVAACTLVVVPNLTRGCRPYGVIENVVTDPAHRRRGHGKALIAHALAHAWSVRCYKVMLLTGRKDEAIARFYTAAGFDAGDKQGFVARPPG